MQTYAALADELLKTMDSCHRRPPQEELGQTMRGEMAVLRLLAGEKRRLPAGDISRRLAMTTSRIAAVLNSLERKGMIIRQADPQDRRRVAVTLTASGEAFCREKRMEAQQNFTYLLERLGEEDAALFVRLLKRVFAILDEDGCPCRRQGGMK